MSFGYVNSGNTKETLKDKKIYIEVEKKKYPVEILQKPLNQKILEINYLTKVSLYCFVTLTNVVHLLNCFNEGAPT